MWFIEIIFFMVCIFFTFAISTSYIKSIIKRWALSSLRNHIHMDYRIFRDVLFDIQYTFNGVLNILCFRLTTLSQIAIYTKEILSSTWHRLKLSKIFLRGDRNGNWLQTLQSDGNFQSNILSIPDIVCTYFFVKVCRSAHYFLLLFHSLKSDMG